MAVNILTNKKSQVMGCLYTNTALHIKTKGEGVRLFQITTCALKSSIAFNTSEILAWFETINLYPIRNINSSKKSNSI